jgi:hypothetical protein
MAVLDHHGLLPDRSDLQASVEHLFCEFGDVAVPYSEP